MSFITKLFSSGTKDLVAEVGEVIDDLHTSEEEKVNAKRLTGQMIYDFEKSIQKEVTERWREDMRSDSWLSKNIRPLTLIFLVACTLLLIFIDSGVLEFEVKEHWVDLLQIILITVIGAYFGGRSYEKIKNKK
tara:strand:- start:136 stop:534 length:399 start_codon:yes stop_codon:yes gene_type:complete